MILHSLLGNSLVMVKVAVRHLVSKNELFVRVSTCRDKSQSYSVWDIHTCVYFSVLINFGWCQMTQCSRGISTTWYLWRFGGNKQMDGKEGLCQCLTRGKANDVILL